MNWTEEQLFEALKKNPALHVKQSELEKLKGSKETNNKFNAKKVYIDGHCFRSQAEGDRYCELKLLKAAGVIKDFDLQPEFDIGIGKYTADFMVTYWDHEEIEEVKGYWTKDAKIRVKLFKEKYPDKILIVIINGVAEEWTNKRKRKG